jgi:hypothetical protein
MKKISIALIMSFLVLGFGLAYNSSLNTDKQNISIEDNPRPLKTILAIEDNPRPLKTSLLAIEDNPRPLSIKLVAIEDNPRPLSIINSYV